MGLQRVRRDLATEQQQGPLAAAKGQGWSSKGSDSFAFSQGTMCTGICEKNTYFSNITSLLEKSFKLK